MPDFRFTRHLGASENPPPTQCATCSTHACDEGFVDLIVSLSPYGRLYMCARCVWAAARLVGCIDPQQVVIKDDALEEMSAANEELAAKLEAEKAEKYVPLADVIDFFDEREKRRPDQPAPATKPKVPAA